MESNVLLYDISILTYSNLLKKKKKQLVKKRFLKKKIKVTLF